MKKELKAFDDYIEEKLKKYPQHLVDYDEVYQLRQKFYERIRSRMMMMLEQAFKNNNKDIQKLLIEKMYPHVSFTYF